MQGPHVHHQAVNVGGYIPSEQELYHRVFPQVRSVLQAVLENEFEESVMAVSQQSIKLIQTELQGKARILEQDLLPGIILEALVQWVHKKSQDLDYMVEMIQAGHGCICDRLHTLKRRFDSVCEVYPNAFSEAINQQRTQAMAEFIYAVVCELLGSDAACLGSTLAGMLLQEAMTDLAYMLEWPTLLLALLVRKLEEIQSKMSKVIIQVYEETQWRHSEDSKKILLPFFQFYTVDSSSGMMDMHESEADPLFANSNFKVNLVDSYGSLLQVLCHIEQVCKEGREAKQEVALAVDFEGEKLCRTGPLRLLQMSCSDDPTLVYVLDVYIMGHRTFTLQTPNGTSMKQLLEDQTIRKVWFDPRNDVDALWHQFNIMPQGIFDLQLAEVATRRKIGHRVQYVSGLGRCLSQCGALAAEQKQFANKINELGKNMFEPQNGGSYEVFRTRPLNPVILVYAAHDSRYMFALYEQYAGLLDPEWTGKVLTAGDRRCQQALNAEYTKPTSEAPII